MLPSEHTVDATPVCQLWVSFRTMTGTVRSNRTARAAFEARAIGDGINRLSDEPRNVIESLGANTATLSGSIVERQSKVHNSNQRSFFSHYKTKERRLT